MLYSTIEEAWSRPRFVEGFDVQGCECDDIIARLLKCPDCMTRVLQMNRKINWREWINVTTAKNSLLAIASLLIIAIIFST